ncbi:MAG: hypothetical protein LBK43_02145 [Treponema sp.]|jgi:hypothetical protein|nr:hypothetical protein [Treponema sp.]
MKKTRKFILTGMVIAALFAFGYLVLSCASMSDEEAYDLGYAIGSSLR